MQNDPREGRAQVLPRREGRQDQGCDPAIGLGIDAGGTYTDVVVYDFDGNSILATSKALTTKWNYTEGIEAALEIIPSHFLQKVDLVSVSTTLATNAIVENQGQKVGMLLMPPYGRFHKRDLPHTPLAVVKGILEIDGTVIEAIDPDQIENVAETMIRDHGVKAFAVSGFGATINAVQEMEVSKILQKRTSLGVTCGHQLSGMLGMYERAITAILNAKIIPYIEAFLAKLEEALVERDIRAPIMVVKGDGTLMSIEMSKERPVETLFSGPAASVAGAKKLTNLEDALVVDIGGTTTDIAAIRNKRVEICPRGNVVAGVHTHVKALKMRTKGLGGDSAINLENQDITIGPLRVTPVAYLAERSDGTSRALDFIEHDLSPYQRDTRPMQLLALTNHTEPISLEPLEREILDLLEERPYSLEELSQKLNPHYRGFGFYARLFRHNIISVSTLTPTDLLHAEGRMNLWDSDTAKRICSLYAGILNLSHGEFAKLVFDAFTRDLATELFAKLMDNDVESHELDSSPASQAILSRWLGQADNDLRVSMRLPYPIIGVGAPAGEFLPEVARLFNTTLLTPENYDVANAIGAITSTVSVSKSTRVAPKGDGHFAIEGLADSREFDDLQEAIDCAKTQLNDEVLKLADRAGVLNPAVETTSAEVTARNAYGGEMFLATIITASVTASPRVRASRKPIA